MESLADIARELKLLKRVIVTTHIAPDADAIGSGASLVPGLSQLGIAAQFYLEDQVPERVRDFVEGVSVIHSLPEQDFDALVVIDSATLNRVGKAAESLRRKARVCFNIDHHVSNDYWGDLNFVDIEAAASAEIALRLLKALEVPISARLAHLLFAGLIDDTGSFRFANTREATFLVAAELVRFGALPQSVANGPYFSLPERVFRLRATALATMQLVCNGRIAMVIIPKAMLEACAARAEDSEGLIDEIRAVEGTIGAALMRELDDGWKISLRSKVDALDVNLVAAKFGGGGHKAASGCKIQGSQAQAAEKLLQELGQAVSKIA